MRTHGHLVRWNDERGFGFVSIGVGGEELFAHVSAFPRDGVRPVIGELLSFDIQAGDDGRRRATRIQRPGTKRRYSRAGQPGPRREQPTSLMAALLPGAALLAILAAGGFLAYERWVVPPEPVIAPAALFSGSDAEANAEATGFSCDGRTQCPQMRSCAEAEYFLRHCPGTEMDGNGDGEPCEQQWCN